MKKQIFVVGVKILNPCFQLCDLCPIALRFSTTSDLIGDKIMKHFKLLLFGLSRRVMSPKCSELGV